MRNAVPAIEPRGAHRARTGLLLSKHELVNHKRAIGRAEELTQAHCARGRIACVERRGPLDKFKILQGRARWELAAKRGDLLALVSQLDFSEAQLFTFQKILCRLVR